MLSHYLKIAFRRFYSEKTFSFINLIGLIVGISSVFLLTKFLGYHLMTDHFQEHKENVFAIHQTLIGNDGVEQNNKSTYNGVAPLVADQFAEVISMSRYITSAESLVTTTNPEGKRNKFNERNISGVDPAFLKMFSFNFLRGDPENALKEENSIVLSTSMAEKYFGDDEPMGKTLKTTQSWGGERVWTVTGVFEDYPTNSKFSFNALQSLIGKEFEVNEQDWSYPFFKSYLLLEESSDAVELSEKMNSMVNGMEAFKHEQRRVDFELVALAKVTKLSDSQKLLILVGLVLMVITWINYTNLSGAKSLSRGKEFGVRKVLGSNKLQLVKQFLFEAQLIYFIAIAAAVVLVISIYPFLFDLTEGRMLPLLDLSTPVDLVFVLLVLLGSLISSVYPSFLVPKTSVITLLKSRKAATSASSDFRKALVVVQLTVAVVMLIGVATIYQQMQFIKNQDMGVDIDYTLILNGSKDGWGGKFERLQSFKDEVRKMSWSRTVSSSTTVPLWWPGAPTDFWVKGSQEEFRFIRIGVDKNYFDCYGLKLVAGSSFNRGTIGRNRELAVVNEMTVKTMGFSTPEEVLGMKIVNQIEDRELEIVGVVSDYHHSSLRDKIEPQVFDFNPYRGFVSIKLNADEHTSFDQLNATIESVEDIWNKVYPDQAFDYYFLNERFDNVYKEEGLFQKIFLMFAIITVVVTFLGIFGLSIFISSRRKKEVGIRKVLGARPIEILALFSWDFVKKALVSMFIGMPIAYYLMTQWLSNFSYHIVINVWIFIIPSMLLTILTIISLSFEGLKLSAIDPVKILKDE